MGDKLLCALGPIPIGSVSNSPCLEVTPLKGVGDRFFHFGNRNCLTCDAFRVLSFHDNVLF